MMGIIRTRNRDLEQSPGRGGVELPQRTKGTKKKPSRLFGSRSTTPTTTTRDDRGWRLGRAEESARPVIRPRFFFGFCFSFLFCVERCRGGVRRHHRVNALLEQCLVKKPHHQLKKKQDNFKGRRRGRGGWAWVCVRATKAHGGLGR